MKGAPAARVVRALVDFGPPVTVPELVNRSGASTGATYRVVEFLEREGLVERATRGPIETIRWRRLLGRWAEDLGFQDTSATRRYLQPRGLTALTTGLAEMPELRYVVTGSLAAQHWAPYAPARTAMVYAENSDQFAAHLGLRAVDAGANVLVAAGEYDVVFERSRAIDGVFYAAPSQTAVDLLTGPGRNPSEADALLDWMEENPDAWRH